jgi:lambda repressor-like predicted transcriptional regulator
MRPLEGRDPWKLLGLEPGSSTVEIRAAFERLSALLAPGSLALYSVADLKEQRQLQRRLREAYLSLVGDAARLEPAAAVADAAAAPAPSDVGDGARSDTVAPAGEMEQLLRAVPATEEFSGAELRARREAAGVSLRDLSTRTRIRPQQLTNVEEEAWDVLPPRVYVRGFVLAIARALKLDPDRVWASYEARWRRARPPAE